MVTSAFDGDRKRPTRVVSEPHRVDLREPEVTVEHDEEVEQDEGQAGAEEVLLQGHLEGLLVPHVPHGPSLDRTGTSIGGGDERKDKIFGHPQNSNPATSTIVPFSSSFVARTSFGKKPNAIQ